MKITVVIPNWNGAYMVLKSLASLTSQTLESSIVVVDNGSVDESVSLIESEFPEVHIIKLTENLGFAGGVNTGIRYALEEGANAIALFNNDAIAEKDWLKHLADILINEPAVGIATGKLMRSDKKHFDSTGDFYSIWGMPFPRGRNQKDSGQYDSKEDVFGATGGASLYRADVFKEIGLFDEKFFAYYEDVDISFRAQLAGWKIMYTPKAIAYHELSATSSKLGEFSRYHATKNFYLLYLKNMPGWLFWKYLPLFLFQAIRLTLSSVVKGKGWTHLRGICRAILYLPAVFRDRKGIKRISTVSPRLIGSLLYKHRPPNIPQL